MAGLATSSHQAAGEGSPGTCGGCGCGGCDVGGREGGGCEGVGCEGGGRDGGGCEGGGCEVGAMTGKKGAASGLSGGRRPWRPGRSGRALVMGGGM